MFRAQQNAFDDAIGEPQSAGLAISEYLMPVQQRLQTRISPPRIGS